MHLTERQQAIVTAARRMAAEHGWSGVSTRALCRELGFTQPVLYRSFPDRQAIVDAVAREGFAELAELVRAVPGPAGPARLRAVCLACLEHAADHPALQEAMFTADTRLRFASAETPAELTEAFAALAELVADERDAELLWASLHGLAHLMAAGRIPHDHTTELVERLASRIQDTPGLP